MDQPAYRGVASSLAEVEFHSAVELLGSYAGRASDLAPLVAGAPINQDLNLRLQYLAGLGVNSTVSPQLYRQLLNYRRFPDGLVTGSPERMNALRALFGRPQRTF